MEKVLKKKITWHKDYLKVRIKNKSDEIVYHEIIDSLDYDVDRYDTDVIKSPENVVIQITQNIVGQLEDNATFPIYQQNYLSPHTEQQNPCSNNWELKKGCGLSVPILAKTTVEYTFHYKK